MVVGFEGGPRRYKPCPVAVVVGWVSRYDGSRLGLSVAVATVLIDTVVFMVDLLVVGRISVHIVDVFH